MTARDAYQIGWICALPLEMAAAQAMLDQVHPQISNRLDDTNTYVLGNIGPQNIVIACLPAGVYGTTAATVTALRMQYSYQSIKVCLMVGIGGGVPSPRPDIRLGDVVVSKPTPSNAGVLQYDFGKALEGGHLVLTGSLNKPPEVLLKALSRLEAEHMIHGNRISVFHQEALNRYPRLREEFGYPGQSEDILFLAEYTHVKQDDGFEQCAKCDRAMLQPRVARNETLPRVFYGLIASANRVVRDAKERDRLARERGIICFEMEAAGLMDIFPCLVIRGVCDYSDSHKTKRWQGYAAAAAAAYAKELTLFLPVYDEYNLLGSVKEPPQYPQTQECGTYAQSSGTVLPSPNSSTSTASASHPTQENFLVEASAEALVNGRYSPVESTVTRSEDEQPRNTKIILNNLPTQDSTDVLEKKLSPAHYLDAMSPKIDTSRVLQMNLAMSRGQKSWVPWPGDCAEVYRAVNLWVSASPKSILLLKASPHAHSRAKNLATQILAFVLQWKEKYDRPTDLETCYQVLWTLGTAEPMYNDPAEILKSLIKLAMQGIRNTAQSYPDIPPKASYEEPELWDLFRLVLTHIPKAFIICESRNPEFVENMLRFARQLADTPTSKIKFLIILHSGLKSDLSNAMGENENIVSVPPPPPQSRKLLSLSRIDFSWSNLSPSF